MTDSNTVDVAVAAVVDAADRVLLARRPKHVHQGDLWEFPGGKLEAGETTFEALQRELQEEVGIHDVRGRPLIRVRHDYSAQSVLLDVWRIDRFSGQPAGCEGQEIKWVHADQLSGYDFPAANQPIITALRLPACYMITPEPGSDSAAFVRRLTQSVRRHDIRLVQLRCKHADTNRLIRLAEMCLPACHDSGAQMLINGRPDILSATGADGLHLSSRALYDFSSRPCDDKHWLAASCHNLADLHQAQLIGVDFAVLSPVLATNSHPAQSPLGWPGFEALVTQASIPVYALGGMTGAQLSQSWQCGGQGIAAIRAFVD